MTFLLVLAFICSDADCCTTVLWVLNRKAAPPASLFLPSATSRNPKPCSRSILLHVAVISIAFKCSGSIQYPGELGSKKDVSMGMQNRYSIMEVEQFVGIPRTKIRHYMDKGLLNVKKDDQSGYYFYSFDDLMRLCQIVYYRENLGFSIERVEQLLATSDIKLIESMTRKQLDFLNEEMHLRDQQRNTMLFNRKMIDRQQKYKDKITLIPFDTAYVVPYAYYFIPIKKVYPIIYGASEFSYNKKEVSHVRRCSLAFEKDAEFVDSDDFESFRVEGERVEGGGMCIYTVSLTSKDVHDPTLLQPAIDWAAKHHFRIKGRIFMIHFFPYYAADNTYTYVEAYLPIDLQQ